VGESGVGEHAHMRVTLVGPDGLDSLDEVTIAIPDEAGVDHWAHGLPDKVSAEEADWFGGGLGSSTRRQRPGYRQQDDPGATLLHAGRQELGPAQPQTNPVRSLDGRNDS
jgi:hypothetical protein